MKAKHTFNFLVMPLLACFAENVTVPTWRCPGPSCWPKGLYWQGTYLQLVVMIF